MSPGQIDFEDVPSDEQIRRLIEEQRRLVQAAEYARENNFQLSGATYPSVPQQLGHGGVEMEVLPLQQIVAEQRPDPTYATSTAPTQPGGYFIPSPRWLSPEDSPQPSRTLSDRMMGVALDNPEPSEETNGMILFKHGMRIRNGKLEKII